MAKNRRTNALQKAAAVGLVGLLFSDPGFAQGGGERTGTGAIPKTEDFVREVVDTSTFEIASAKLAIQRGDESVKSFAEKMIRDQDEITGELRELISSGKVHAELPTELTIHQNIQVRRLKSLQGPAFKKQYVIDQALTHKNAALLFKRYSDAGDNADLKGFAKKYLPMIQMHWQMTQQLNNAP
jgi:putative membrane protein